MILIILKINEELCMKAYRQSKAEKQWALFKKFCKRDFCDEVRDFKIPEPEAVAS